MNKLLTTLFAVACISPAFAADAPQPAAPADAKASSDAGQLVTPQSQAAAYKDIVAKMKSDAKAAKGEKPAEAKK